VEGLLCVVVARFDVPHSAITEEQCQLGSGMSLCDPVPDFLGLINPIH
jgi:hypothetical protein